jgi:Glycosyltransferase
MKILLATRSVTPNSGVPSYNREVSAFLSREHHIDLLVTEDLKACTPYRKVYSTYGMSLDSFDGCQSLVQSINAESYDLIINSNSEFAAVLAPFWNDNTKVISVSHSLGTVDCINAVYNADYTDHIIALSQGCRSYISRHHSISSHGKISVVFNSIASHLNADFIRDRKKTSEQISIVFAGGSAPSKSPDIIVQVLHKLCKTNRDFVFYWLGITTPPLKRLQPFRNIQDVLPNDSRIKVLGKIPQNEAAEIIANSNVFFAPSRREGFPMALLEAMRIGCIPIVADYNIANREIIIDGYNGFVISHNNIDGFVNKIIDIIDRPSTYDYIYDNCYHTFEDKLCFDVWYKQMSSVLANSDMTHSTRIPFTKYAFKRSLIGYSLSAKLSFFENFCKEIVPCAYKFRNFYRKYNK